MDLQWLPCQYYPHLMLVRNQDFVFVTREHALFQQLEDLKGIQDIENPIEREWYKVSERMLRQAYIKHVTPSSENYGTKLCVA